jgi:hypothetical protein
LQPVFLRQRSDDPSLDRLAALRTAFALARVRAWVPGRVRDDELVVVVLMADLV